MIYIYYNYMYYIINLYIILYPWNERKGALKTCDRHVVSCLYMPLPIQVPSGSARETVRGRVAVSQHCQSTTPEGIWTNDEKPQQTTVN